MTRKGVLALAREAEYDRQLGSRCPPHEARLPYSVRQARDQHYNNIAGVRE